jgi:putative colanic acid biosysnthesis UDP-glucose lipid carrier transferase
MNNRFLKLLQLYVGIIDLIVINIFFYLTLAFFKSTALIGFQSEYVYFGFFLNFTWLFLVFSINIYNEKYILSFEKFTSISLQAYLYFLLIVVFYLFFFRILVLSRVFITTILTAIPVGLLISRFLYLSLYQYFKTRLLLANNVLIIGYNDLSKRLVDYLEEDGINKKIIGYCEEYENIEELSKYPILSSIEQALEVCRAYRVDEIYSTIAPEQNPVIYKLIEVADEHCIHFKIVPDLGFFVNKKFHLDHIKEIPVIVLRKEPLADLGNRIKKRIFDIIVSTFVIALVLSRLIPIIGLIIWLESKGPIFFIQLRTGKNNSVFPCFKFRSMYVNDGANLLQASKNDTRITKVGDFLRRTSLDEFPQFLNVFKGEMSIVGPRPHMVKHTNEYSQLISKYMVRQFLKPGITGWAQVNGFRGETQTVYQMQKRVEYDLWYLENWSLLTDLRIMFLTAFNILRGEKNAF